MTLGFVMLAHEALHRAVDVISVLDGNPVVVHVDKMTRPEEFDPFVESIRGIPGVTLAPREACDWGTWSLVKASLGSAEILLKENPDVQHVALISGACLPIKPIDELRSFLSAHPDTDFIESVTIKDVPWTKGGLSEERFDFTFPFAWRRQKSLFDLWVNIQRKLKRKRKAPENFQPHLGSQWWCLTRQTLETILNDPNRAQFENFFRKVWIPDESYYQTLVRVYGTKVESRSLTLSKFDFQGKPHLFYDDHLKLLQQSPAFFARKIWPGADLLYATFLGQHGGNTRMGPAHPVEQKFEHATARRTRGRAGLVMASRFPAPGFENGTTAAPYAVFQGFSDLFVDFPAWLTQSTGGQAHGHLFHKDTVEFAENSLGFTGGLSNSASLRDYDPEAFLRNLVWNTQGQHQSFMLSPRDTKDIWDFILTDRNATIAVVSGAWSLQLMRSHLPTSEVRRTAARLQNTEAEFLDKLSERRTNARVLKWTLAEFLEYPNAPLQDISGLLSARDDTLLENPPALVPLEGLKDFLEELRDSGMNPYLAGLIGDLRSPDSPVQESYELRPN